jgi:hypothetical protein
MTTTIKTHLNELQTSATRMLVLNSDNKMLISFFSDLCKKLLYLQELINLESKYDWQEIEILIENLIKQDKELTNININYQFKEVVNFKNEALIKVKKYI